MEVDFQQMKKHNVKIQYLIFGYVRKSKSLLSNSLMYCNISDLITYTILAYYQPIEYFQHYNSEKVKISDDKYTITAKLETDEGVTCYGSVIIPYDSKGIHKWKFKLEHVTCSYCIGVDEVSYKWENRTLYDAKGTNNYSYAGTSGGKYGSSGQWTQYSVKYKTNDIVEMVFNLNTKMLSFGVNGHKLKDAFMIINSDIGYAMAVSVYTINDSITLLSYSHALT
eukprot:384839_1